MTQIEVSAVHSTTSNNSVIRRLVLRIDRRALLTAALLFTLSTALFALIQFSTPNLADNDGFYHMRMGALIREQGLRISFPWLPLTILGPHAFYDHHLLFHVYLSLFGGDGSETALLLGAKIASVIMPALAFVAIWWLLRGQRVRGAALWSIGLFAVSEAFLYRMSMPRAQSASLFVLALSLHALLQRKFRRLMPLGFIYVWLFDGFPILMVMTCVYFAATWLTERRLEWQALAFPALGLVLGLIVNPYFPQNITFIVSHLLPKIDQSTLSVGNEWFPYQTWTLVENSGFALAAFLLGAFALGWRDEKIDRPTLTAFLLSIVFGLMLFKARRFVEYFPAFALIFAALSLAPLLDRMRVQRLIPIGLAAILSVPLAITVTQARAAMIDQSQPADTYATAAHWLKDNATPGSLIFQTDWDDFPRLFFYNTSNVYTVGLDPTYMQLYDAALYDEWVQITQGKVERPSGEIRSRFGGAYVLTDLAHEAFLNRAKADPGLREVYRDQYAIVYAVVN